MRISHPDSLSYFKMNSNKLLVSPPLLSTLPYFIDMKQLPLVVEQRGSKRGKKGNKDSSCI